MGVRDFLSDLFGTGPSVNPATGLPMMGGGVDVAGNPFGVDLHRHDHEAGASTGWSGSDDHHHRIGLHDYWSGSAGTDWDGSFSSGTSGPWLDHPSPSGGYDPIRGW